MTNLDEDYAAHIDMILGSLAQRHAQGDDIEAADCVIGLEHGRFENKKLRDYVTRALKIKATEFDAALRRAVAASAGITATTPRELVVQVANKLHVTVTYSGRLHKKEVPYIVSADGKRQYIAPGLWDTYDFKTMIAAQFHCDIGYDDFAREVRMTAAEFGLPFRVAELNDAADEWHAKTSIERLWQIAGTVDYTDRKDIRTRGQADLIKLAQTCFECPHGEEFIAAVINKFIWQIKRKIGKLPVTDHLMPVILGAQGIGKSTLIRAMLAVIAELWVPSDFRQITDDRNTMLWKNFVIFMDEMGYASKSDMETVKNIITAETLNRRIMQTTKYNVVAQNATFIGAANAGELSELIRDVSGTRRFIALDMLRQPDRDVINSVDWLAVWQSVDPAGADPMTAFRDVLQAVQAGDRTTTPVEEWLSGLDYRTSLGGALTIEARQFTATELFQNFSLYESEFFPGLRVKQSVVGFGKEMKRLCNRIGRDGMPFSPFVRYIKGDSAVFEWRAKPPVHVTHKFRVV